MTYWPPDYTQTPGAPPLQLPRQDVLNPRSYQQLEWGLSRGWVDQLQYAGYNPQHAGYYPHQPQGGGGVGAYPGGFNALGYPNQNPGGYLSPFALGNGYGAPTNSELAIGAFDAIERLCAAHYGRPYVPGPLNTGFGGIGGGWNGLC